MSRSPPLPETPFAAWFHNVCVALEYLGFPPPLHQNDLWWTLWRAGCGEWDAIMRHPMPAVRAAAETLARRMMLARAWREGGDGDVER